jgi:hypothetical protein
MLRVHGVGTLTHGAASPDSDTLGLIASWRDALLQAEARRYIGSQSGTRFVRFHTGGTEQLTGKKKLGRPVAILSFRDYWYEEVDADLVAGLSFLEREDLKFHSIVKWQSAPGGRTERRIQMLPAHLKAILGRLDECERRRKHGFDENSELRQEVDELREGSEILRHELGLLQNKLKRQNEEMISSKSRHPSEKTTEYPKNSLQQLQENAPTQRGQQVSGGLPSLGRRK